jgi:hypothetical protein
MFTAGTFTLNKFAHSCAIRARAGTMRAAPDTGRTSDGEDVILAPAFGLFIYLIVKNAFNNITYGLLAGVSFGLLCWYRGSLGLAMDVVHLYQRFKPTPGASEVRKTKKPKEH